MISKTLEQDYAERAALAQSQGYRFSIGVFKVSGYGVVADMFGVALRHYLHANNGHVPPDILVKDDNKLIAFVEGSVCYETPQSLMPGRASDLLDSFMDLAAEKAGQLGELLKIDAGMVQFSQGKSLAETLEEAERSSSRLVVSYKQLYLPMKYPKQPHSAEEVYAKKRPIEEEETQAMHPIVQYTQLSLPFTDSAHPYFG